MMLKPILRKFEPVVQADLTEEREMILNRRDRNCIFFLEKNRKILKKKFQKNKVLKNMYDHPSWDFFFFFPLFCQNEKDLVKGQRAIYSQDAQSSK